MVHKEKMRINQLPLLQRGEDREGIKMKKIPVLSRTVGGFFFSISREEIRWPG